MSNHIDSARLDDCLPHIAVTIPEWSGVEMDDKQVEIMEDLLAAVAIAVVEYPLTGDVDQQQEIIDQSSKELITLHRTSRPADLIEGAALLIAQAWVRQQRLDEEAGR